MTFREGSGIRQVAFLWLAVVGIGVPDRAVNLCGSANGFFPELNLPVKFLAFNRGRQPVEGDSVVSLPKRGSLHVGQDVALRGSFGDLCSSARRLRGSKALL